MVDRLLLELRPALEGHAGIPQETRLLFSGLSALDGFEVDGLLMSGGNYLAAGLPVSTARAQRWPAHRRMHRLARVVISLHRGPSSGPLRARMEPLLRNLRMLLPMALALLGHRQPLTRFEPEHFEDFIWRGMFEKTLSTEEKASVTSRRFRIARLPWSAMHAGAIATSRVGLARFPRFDTQEYSVLVAETPFPGRVDAGTRLVVRYHDAVPLLMPHTIVDKSFHEAAHYLALRRNVQDGAWFACVSDASRRDLVSIFPEVAPRAVTIPNMVSAHFFPEEGAPERIPDILQTRSAAVPSMGLPAAPVRAALMPDYLLMVSTFEPRKNHVSLLSAWEKLRAGQFPHLRLVLVGSMGWDHKPILGRFAPWISRGLVHILNDVPANELRLLYQHAKVTVCPSLGEGFGYSGIEAMRCGGVVVASDLPVHREVYADAAEYFDAYSPRDMAERIADLMHPEKLARREDLIQRGAEVSARYLPQAVVPLWQDFLSRLVAGERETA